MGPSKYLNLNFVFVKLMSTDLFQSSIFTAGLFRKLGNTFNCEFILLMHLVLWVGHQQ